MQSRVPDEEPDTGWWAGPGGTARHVFDRWGTTGTEVVRGDAVGTGVVRWADPGDTACPAEPDDDGVAFQWVDPGDTACPAEPDDVVAFQWAGDVDTLRRQRDRRLQASWRAKGRRAVLGDLNPRLRRSISICRRPLVEITYGTGVEEVKQPPKFEHPPRAPDMHQWGKTHVSGTNAAPGYCRWGGYLSHPTLKGLKELR